MKIFSGFDDVDVDEKRMTKTKTKDERRKTKDVDRKKTKEGKIFSKQTCVREGATVDVLCRPFCFPYLPSSAGCFVRAGRAAILHGVNQFYRKAP
jgi:hypothetical protein